MSHRGVCVGGPMAGLTVTTRSDLGFVAVDAEGSGAWLYYIEAATGRYLLDTRPDTSSLDDDGTRLLDVERAYAAGLDKGLDVIALPGADDEAPAEPPVIDDSADQEGQD